MPISSRGAAAATLLIASIVGVAAGSRVIPTALPTSTAGSPESRGAIPQAEPSPTPPWGGPLPNGAPGPGASPCIDVSPGDCGQITDYDAGLVPYKPTPRR